MSETGAEALTAIEVAGLTKTFNGRPALRDITFSAAKGELLAVIGPNGAGKTTLLSILAGIREPDSGTVSISGSVGWVPQSTGLYKRLTVAENLRLFARLEELEDVEGAVEEMLDQTGLADRRNDQVSTLSGGNQQRVNLAIGLLASPAVLLLDEPSTGLDPRQRARLWEFVIHRAGTGTTVIYSTHHMHEADRYADHLLVLADGERIFTGTTAELRAASEAAPDDFEAAFVAFLAGKGH